MKALDSEGNVWKLRDVPTLRGWRKIVVISQPAMLVKVDDEPTIHTLPNREDWQGYMDGVVTS